MKMDMNKVKKIAEAANLFSEYLEQFFEWVEENNNCPEATHSFDDRWNGQSEAEQDDIDQDVEKKELPILVFKIQFFFVDDRFPTMRILNDGREYYRVTITNNKMTIETNDVTDIENF